MTNHASLSRDPVVEALLTAETMLDGGGWCQHHLAVDRRGRPCAWNSETVAKFSIEGALLVGADANDTIYEQAERLVARVLPSWAENLAMFNDASDMNATTVKIALVQAATLANKQKGN